MQSGQGSPQEIFLRVPERFEDKFTSDSHYPSTRGRHGGVVPKAPRAGGGDSGDAPRRGLIRLQRIYNF